MWVVLCTYESPREYSATILFSYSATLWTYISVHHTWHDYILGVDRTSAFKMGLHSGHMRHWVLLMHNVSCTCNIDDMISHCQDLFVYHSSHVFLLSQQNKTHAISKKPFNFRPHILMCCFVCMKKNVKLMWEKIINTVPISAPFHASLILAQKRTRRKCKQCYKSQFLFVRQRPLLRWAMLLKRLLNPTRVHIFW